MEGKPASWVCSRLLSLGWERMAGGVLKGGHCFYTAMHPNPYKELVSGNVSKWRQKEGCVGGLGPRNTTEIRPHNRSYPRDLLGQGEQKTSLDPMRERNRDRGKDRDRDRQSERAACDGGAFLTGKHVAFGGWRGTAAGSEVGQGASVFSGLA